MCLLYPSLFFPLAFVLVNDLFSGFSLFLFWKCVRFCFCFCCCLFLFVVCACILCLLPCHTRCSFINVLSCTPTGVSEINYLTSRRREKVWEAQTGAERERRMEGKRGRGWISEGEGERERQEGRGRAETVKEKERGVGMGRETNIQRSGGGGGREKDKEGEGGEKGERKVRERELVGVLSPVNHIGLYLG